MKATCGQKVYVYELMSNTDEYWACNLQIECEYSQTSNWDKFNVNDWNKGWFWTHSIIIHDFTLQVE